MIEILKCRLCNQKFKVTKTGKKKSNGSWERFYENGVKLVNIKCYPCFRSWMSDTWFDRKPAAVSYEKTKKGFLMRKYRNMASRVKGVQKAKYHLYKGKDLLPKEDFYRWALANRDFHELFKAWEESGYNRKLCPSVDRIDSDKGYTIDNMQFITHSENSAKVRRK